MTSPTRILVVTIAIAALLAGRDVCAEEAQVDRNGPKMPSPVRLTVAATTTVKIALAWDPVPGATCYVLHGCATPRRLHNTGTCRLGRAFSCR